MNVCVLGTNLLSAPDRFDKRIDRNGGGGGIVAYKINLEGQCLKDSVIFQVHYRTFRITDFLFSCLRFISWYVVRHFCKSVYRFLYVYMKI